MQTTAVILGPDPRIYSVMSAVSMILWDLALFGRHGMDRRVKPDDDGGLW